jgi:hypothetical protein
MTARIELSMKHGFIGLILGSLLLFVSLDSVHASQSRDVRTTRNELVWIGANAHEERTALSLLMGSPEQPTMATRRVLLYDGERRLIATWRIDRATGMEHVHVLDDATGWWALVRLKLGVRSPPDEEYPQFSQRREAWLQPGQGHEIELRVTTSTGFESRHGLPATLDFEGLLGHLVEELKQVKTWREAKREIPTEVLSSAEGWQGLLRYRSNASLAIVFLNEISGASENVGQQRLTVSETPMRGGIRPESPRWQELLRTFEHFDPDDPLPKDLFESADSPSGRPHGVNR